MTGPVRVILGIAALLVCQPSPRAETSTQRIEVSPNEVSLVGKNARQQLVVTEIESNGAIRDLTVQARFLVEPAEIAIVSQSGVVTPRTDGTGTVVVDAQGCQARISLRVEDSNKSRPVSFRHDVVAVLSKAGCNMGACHGNLNGKGGFRLSLRGEDPSFDLRSMTRDALARRANLSEPSSSLIVRKPTGQVPHEGGQRFTSSSPEAAALVGWLASGARDDAAVAPRLTRLEVSPSERIAAAPSLAQQLVVTATFADGTRRDVTRAASYDVSDPTRASVTTDGRVEADRPTETTIAIRYLNGRAVSRLAFLRDRPDFVWRAPLERNVVDRHVFARLKSLRINPAELSTDAIFLRRASLDAIGRLPRPEEVRSFVADTDPDKRRRLVRSLIARPEFADFWALKWADLLRNEEKTMGEKGVWVFHRWLRDQFAADLPLDEFTRRLITAKGSTWENPPASFYRTNRDPFTTAETVSQVFLGVRLQCARCHNHPFDVWTQDDYYGLAAFFANVRQKDLSNVRKDELDKHEINGDEIIYLQGIARTVQPRSGEMLSPKAPLGPKVNPVDRPDARTALADWLTHDNRQFAQNLANRVWFHLLGRGIVDPVDDFRDSNPPSNPPLLDALTDELIKRGYRLQPLVELIMTSQTYQLGPAPNDSNAEDDSNFSRASVRLLPAEVLLDALGQALGKPERFGKAPSTLRATQFPGAKGGSFLRIFGKPERLLTCECERSESTTLAQAFQLINGPDVRAMLESSSNRIGRLLQAGANDDAILDELTLAALGREPSASERADLLIHVQSASDRRKGWEDVAWAIVNSKEFLLRH